MRKLVGRTAEINILQDALYSDRPELIVVYGRRRIGKTFLIEKVYEKHIQFAFSGIYGLSYKNQLVKFHLKLSEKKSGLSRPKNWIEAFYQLGLYLDTLTHPAKKVIFIDEFPWLDTRRSNFLPAFDNFWNDYVSKREDLIVVVCGSAASYMVRNLIHSKGGLHNRLTETIHLKPFNLYETEQLLKAYRIRFSRYDILHIYMVMGGIPHYLEKIKRGESAAQVIDRLCFTENGFLRREFDEIFSSLFSHPENHVSIINTLAKVRKGMTRTQILAKSRVKSGGTLTKNLNELEKSGFIEKYIPYRGTRNALYRLVDQYAMFYTKFVSGTTPSNVGVWQQLYTKQSFKTWAGYCFETICIRHIEQIKAALGISGVLSKNGSWIENNSKKGAQIDLLIDRADNVINLCEIKFHNARFTIDKKYAEALAQKVSIFAAATKTKKSIFLTMITSKGLTRNTHSMEQVQSALKMDILFKDV